MYCIDASVILSAARGTESASKRSRLFLDALKVNQEKVFLPHIALPEIASGLMRATGDAPFTASFVEALRDVPNFSFVAVDSDLSNTAVHVILKTSLRGADALYVALTLEYGLTLITLDREQLKRGADLVSVREP